MPSPITHISGYLYGLELLFAAGMKVVFMDRWNSEEAVDLIAAQQATFTVAATPFLVEMVNELEGRNSNLPSLKYFGCGGAPVAPDSATHACATRAIMRPFASRWSSSFHRTPATEARTGRQIPLVRLNPIGVDASELRNGTSTGTK